MFDFLLVNRTYWTFSLSIIYGSGVMSRNVYSSAVFAGDRPLCIEVLPGQGGPPSAILGIRKLEIVGYLVVKTASLCVPSSWQNTGMWRTDRRICRSIYGRLQSYSFATRCKMLSASHPLTPWSGALPLDPTGGTTRIPSLGLAFPLSPWASP